MLIEKDRESAYLILVDWTFTSLGVDGRFQRRLINLLLNIIDKYGLLQTAQIIGKEA